MDRGQITLDWEKEVSRVELTVNTNRTKGLSLAGHCCPGICINKQNTEGVDPVVYLGSVVSVGDGKAEFDVPHCISSARSALLFCLKSENADISTQSG